MSNFAGHQYYALSATHSLPGRHPPLSSPPEPDHDASHTPQSSFLGAGPDLDGVSAGGHHISSERSRLQPRRTSTLSYQNSGARDFHDRGNPKSPRNLVVVLPPPDFPLEQGHLGSVLSMGPRHRLSQGILMPLFPSMFGQLNAIAREYNFPSTIGLCLYLHINENGITMTPRLSDDSWQYLFGHLFDARPVSNGYQLPIGGSVEFDIDPNKARWFDSWVSGTLRDTEPAFPPVAPSRTSSVFHHWRGESRTTNADEQPFEERWDVSGSQTPPGNSRPETLRHLPRKLSLVDRLQPHINHSATKVYTQANSPPETYLTHALSPIPQSATIPQTANSDLERRVDSWRQSTELFPVSMTEAYQPAADIGIPAVVRTTDEHALDRHFHPEASFDECHWSVISAGPNGPMTWLPVPSPRPPSVQIDRRVNGSVPVTPAIATSWGPGDQEWHSVVSNISRLPSPDLGERMVEDAEAPRPRAVWGNSFGWRTATTWREVYPHSGSYAKPVIEVKLRDSGGLVSQYPDLVIYPPVSSHLDRTHGQQDPAVYPSLEIYPACTVEDVSQPVSVTLKGSAGLVASYPNLVIYPAVYPHLDIYPLVMEAIGTKAQGPIDTKLFSSDSVLNLYPNLVIYPAIYPHFDLYPRALEVAETTLLKEVVVRLVNAVSLSPEYPNLVIYPNVYPYLDIYPVKETSATKRLGSSNMERFSGKQAVWGTSFGWSNAATWRMVWPTSVTQMKSISVQLARPGGLPSEYPHLVIYPAAYPHLDIYPTRVHTTEVKESQVAKYEQTVALVPHYPNLTIYPAAYPHLDIYPPFAKALITSDRERGGGSLPLRRTEAWRARTPAQVGLAALLANNHNWEADKPLELNLGDCALSATSTGPSTFSPPQLLRTPYHPPSVRLDRRVEGSVLLAPSTATTWGPQADDWSSDIASTERLPSPDIAQRVSDDVHNPLRGHQPLRMVWPFLSQAKTPESSSTVFEAHYSNLVAYPAAYPHFDLYPARVKASTSEGRIRESLARATCYSRL